MKRKGSIAVVALLLLALTWRETSAAEANAEAEELMSMMLRRRLRPRPTTSKASKKPSFCFVTPYTGLFVQEEPDAAAGSKKRRVGSGGGGGPESSLLQQHPDFGARVPWKFIRDLADDKLGGGGSDSEKANASSPSSPCPGCFLVYAIRHGRAVSNAVQQFVGDAAWNAGIGQKCTFAGDVPELRGEERRKGEKNASWPLFDAPLSARGREQASSLGQLLGEEGGWAKTLVGGGDGGKGGDTDDDVGERAVVVASPLSRTLDTALLALGPAFLSSSSSPSSSSSSLLLNFHVSEWARETTGVNTCDARRGVSGKSEEEELASQLRGRRRRSSSGQHHHHCSCSYDKGLRELYPSSSSSSSLSPSSSFDGFPVVGRGKAPWSPEKDEEEEEEEEEAFSSLPPLPGLFSKDDELFDPEVRETDESVRERTQVFLEVATALASRGEGGNGGRSENEEEEEEEKKGGRGGGDRHHRRVFVVAHSGWIEQLLFGVGRRGFVPDNAELVPLLVQRREGDECRGGGGVGAGAGAGGGGLPLEEE